MNIGIYLYYQKKNTTHRKEASMITRNFVVEMGTEKKVLATLEDYSLDGLKRKLIKGVKIMAAKIENLGGAALLNTKALEDHYTIHIIGDEKDEYVDCYLEEP